MPRVASSLSRSTTKLKKQVEIKKYETFPNRRISWIVQYIVVESGVALLYGFLAFYTPSHYLFEMAFCTHVVMAIINFFTSMIKRSSLLMLRSFFSAFHFACFLYAALTVPIYLTVIAMPEAECNPLFHFCVLGATSEPEAKGVAGILAQSVFAICLFEKMRLLRLFAEFHFSEPNMMLKWTVFGPLKWPDNSEPNANFVNHVVVKPGTVSESTEIYVTSS